MTKQHTADPTATLRGELAAFHTLSEQILTAKFQTIDMRKAGRALPARFRKSLAAKEDKAEELLDAIASPELRRVSELIWSLAGIWAHECRVIALQKEQRALLDTFGSPAEFPHETRL